MNVTHAILLAAGRGERFGSRNNKIWARIGGQPVVWWALHAFDAHPDVQHIVLVTSDEDMDSMKALAKQFDKVTDVVEGGHARWESVMAGLDAIDDDDGLVLVHDCARAAVSADLITRVTRCAQQHGAAVPVVRISDTLWWVDADGHTHGTTARSARQNDGVKVDLMRVQTPQGFSLGVLRSAYDRFDFREGNPTDDASVVEAFHPVTVVPGETTNIKLTYPEDQLEMEEILLGSFETRTGFGYDSHQLVDDRELILGGIQIESEMGLAGHSDADALLHAIIDALLGAAGHDDIGTLFPDTDPAYKNADSADLLRSSWSKVAADGWSIENIDATIIAEAPRMHPYVSQMRQRIAEILQITAERVNVKATTNEKMGFIGRKEGIACTSVATLRRRPETARL